MKTMIFGLLTLLSLTAHADGLPDGVYSGNGFWRSEDGTTGTYSVEATISGTSVSETYILPDGSSKFWAFDLVATKPGFFKVEVSGQGMGSGYCIENVALCHYSLESGLEETLTAVDRHLYRVGSKLGPNGEKIFWQEALQKN